MRVLLACATLCAANAVASPESESEAAPEGRGRSPVPALLRRESGPQPRAYAALAFDTLFGSYTLDDPSSPFNQVTYASGSGFGLGGDVGVQWTESIASVVRVRSVLAPEPNQLLQVTATFELTPIELFSFGLGAGAAIFFQPGVSFGPFNSAPARAYGAMVFPASAALNLGTRVAGHRVALRVSVEGGLYALGALFGVGPWVGGTVGAVFF